MLNIQPFFVGEEDLAEVREWVDSLESVIKYTDLKHAAFILKNLVAVLKKYDQSVNIYNTPYINTLQQADVFEQNSTAVKASKYIKWNAIAMVAGAAKRQDGLGGHISTYASSSVLYDVGFNYFFKGRDAAHLEDCIFTQGHASPGMYARALLEDRLTKDQVLNFRQECNGQGVSSYPHPYLMPNFWQFPTVSMGLGPLSAVYHARFIKYLINRKMLADTNRKVWAFCGDGEMDEPETLSALSFASYEGLDNLIFVVNCNLQRLDGLVRSAGSIVQELEARFSAAGWRVIKVLFNSAWDKLFAKDKFGALQQVFDQCIDGQLQRFSNGGGKILVNELFSKSPLLQELIKDMTSEEIEELSWGGHDFIKVYSAYAAAIKEQSVPTVILAQTTKGYGVPTAQGVNTAHNVKKLSNAALIEYAKINELPLTEEQVVNCELITAKMAPEVYEFLVSSRQKLGGFLPKRHAECEKLPVPDLAYFSSMFESSEDRKVSSTMSFVRVLSLLLRFDGLKQHVVPIVADESRTFGMEGLFRQLGIYNRHGQNYEPVDRNQVMYYKESTSGQLLQEGINEAGATSSWLAAATSYSHSKIAMVPFYIFYSMFGFQRVADIIWAAADSRARGFLIGATAGRTSLAGEGLQHTDGHSHIFASVVPNCKSYDPAYSFELAVIIQHGLKRMVEEQQDEFYYITVGNDNINHLAMPQGEDIASGIVKGMYLLKKLGQEKAAINFLSCGAILPEVILAAESIYAYKGISVNIWSVTSFNELARDGAECLRQKLLMPESKEHKKAYITSCLAATDAPVLAVTDYLRSYADQVRSYINNDYVVLGTDGFGRSDTRESMRKFFEIDWQSVAYTACVQLFNNQVISEQELIEARKFYNIDVNKLSPMQC
jgi:pyruvate dehydrogenase E1 component